MISLLQSLKSFLGFVPSGQDFNSRDYPPLFEDQQMGPSISIMPVQATAEDIADEVILEKPFDLEGIIEGEEVESVVVDASTLEAPMPEVDKIDLQAPVVSVPVLGADGLSFNLFAQDSGGATVLRSFKTWSRQPVNEDAAPSNEGSFFHDWKESFKVLSTPSFQNDQAPAPQPEPEIIIPPLEDNIFVEFEGEVVQGTDARDRLNGTGESDGISGNGGADVLKGYGGNDYLEGGDGNDNLQGGSGDDVLAGGAGNDRLTGSQGADRLFGGDGNDRLVGGSGDDILEGGAGADRLHGGSGTDILMGGEGDDVLIAGGGNDSSLYGNSGDDKIYGGNKDDSLHGGEGADRLSGGRGNDYLDGGGGGDTLLGGRGDDTAVYDSDLQRVNLGHGDDTLFIAHDHVDFSALAGLIDYTENIDLGGGASLLDIGLSAVRGSGIERISGVAGSKVTFEDSFQDTGIEEINGQDYSVFKYDSTTLYIDTDITVVTP